MTERSAKPGSDSDVSVLQLLQHSFAVGATFLALVGTWSQARRAMEKAEHELKKAQAMEEAWHIATETNLQHLNRLAAIKDSYSLEEDPRHSRV
jgi:hypothetical protein